MGGRSALDRTAVVGADRCVTQNGPFGAHRKIVGYSRSQDHSSHLGPGCVLSPGEG